MPCILFIYAFKIINFLQLEIIIIQRQWLINFIKKICYVTLQDIKFNVYILNVIIYMFVYITIYVSTYHKLEFFKLI